MDWCPLLSTRTGEPALCLPVVPANAGAYCETGVQAYREHYLHLWQEGDPRPYLERHFSLEQVLNDLENPALRHGLLQYRREWVGIFKLDLSRDSGDFYPGRGLFLEKIYLKKACTGLGLGGALLQGLRAYARSIGRQAIWLETMRKGPARAFYLQQGFRFLSDTEVPFPQVLPQERAMWVMGLEA